MKMELIDQLIESELKEVDEKWTNYHSHHEAYAVIKEEVEELQWEIERVDSWLGMYWDKVKNPKVKVRLDEKGLLNQVKNHAHNAIKEAVQVYVTALRVERLINKNNK